MIVSSIFSNSIERDFSKSLVLLIASVTDNVIWLTSLLIAPPSVLIAFSDELVGWVRRSAAFNSPLDKIVRSFTLPIREI